MLGGPVDGITSSVACRTCSACCRSYDVPLEQHESGEGLQLVERDGVRYLRRVDGACAHLTDTGCSVHSHRPAACRVYDCREFAVVGVRYDNKPLVNEAIEQWSVSPAGQHERELIARLRNKAQHNAAYGARLMEAVRRAYMEA